MGHSNILLFVTVARWPPCGWTPRYGFSRLLIERVTAVSDTASCQQLFESPFGIKS